MNEQAVTIAPFDPADRNTVNALGTAAYAQFEGRLGDWERFAAGPANLASLAVEGQLLVAKSGDCGVVGAVGYFGPLAPKPDFFDPADAVIRLLAVAPEARGRGIGKRLTAACLALARQDRAAGIALHTSPVMEAALAMYLRAGFRLHRKLPDRFDVPYAVYRLELEEAA